MFPISQAEGRERGGYSYKFILLSVLSYGTRTRQIRPQGESARISGLKKDKWDDLHVIFLFKRGYLLRKSLNLIQIPPQLENLRNKLLCGFSYEYRY